MQATVPADARWRKSTRSDGGENCVEVWRGPQVTAVRDSKNAAGPMLTLPASALNALLDTAAE